MMRPHIHSSKLVAMALAVGVFFTAEEAFMDLARRRSDSAGQDLINGFKFWLVWALLAPAIGMALRRWPLTARDVRRPLIAHSGMALTLAVVHNLVTGLFQGDGGPVAFVWGLFTGLIYYAVVVMLSTALGLRTELAQVKLDALRSQLRPHFLFNTLNAISVFIGEDTAKARELILRLSALLRRSLDAEAHEVPLEEELAFANDYLDIQRGRFGDRLAVVLDVHPETSRALIPVFLLQPLLENAIEHGMRDDRPITVTLRASRADDVLRLVVIDDGVGLAVHRGRGNGVGIANTRARLEQLYGAGSTVDWLSSGQTPASGTCVEICLPYRDRV